MNNLGILLIDMQEVFVLGSPRREIDELIESQKKLLDYAKTKDIPVFVLECEHYGKTEDELMKKLVENKSYFIPKFNDNAFKKTTMIKTGEMVHREEVGNLELLNKLYQEKVENLILTGINKDVCVLETAQGAQNRHYNIFTSRDLMNMKQFKERWYYWHSNHYETLTELLEAISKD